LRLIPFVKFLLFPFEVVDSLEREGNPSFPNRLKHIGKHYIIGARSDRETEQQDGSLEELIHFGSQSQSASDSRLVRGICGF
jgi:hypothetical protein